MIIIPQDGTCRRDFIHVVGLVKAHVKDVEYAVIHGVLETFNLGTGKTYRFLDIIKTFESATGVRIKYEIGQRRAGDLPECRANADKAANLLGWRAE